MAAARLARKGHFAAIMAKNRMLPTDARTPRYRLMAELADGGFSQVWIARDLTSTTRSVYLLASSTDLVIVQASLPLSAPADNRPRLLSRPYVAIKCCRASRAPAASNASDEVRILRQLSGSAIPGSESHPGAGSVLAWVDNFVIGNSEDPTLYHQCIVSELVVPLCDESLDIPDTAPLMRQLVDAMHFLHSQSIVHGDPHFGNIGIAIDGIQQIPEHDLLKLLDDDVALVSALEDIEADDTIDCYNIVPKSARTARLKLYDFGRSYVASKDNLYGAPPFELMGDNPVPCRSPEVDMYRISGGKVGIHWNFGCDVWALGSMLFKLARPTVNFVPNHGDYMPESYRIVKRCLPGGAPPREWLDYCDMGSAVLTCLQEEEQKRRGSSSDDVRSGDTDERVHDQAWVLREMARLSGEFWHDMATRRSWEDPSFPLAEFCSMIKSMMVLDLSKRATLAEVINHEFWSKYSGGAEEGKAAQAG